jgi:hypothetical protein
MPPPGDLDGRHIGEKAASRVVMVPIRNVPRRLMC